MIRIIRTFGSSVVPKRTRPRKVSMTPAKKKDESTFLDVLKNTRIISNAQSEEEAEKFFDLVSVKILDPKRPDVIDWDKASKAVYEAERHFPPLKKFTQDELYELKESSLTFNAAKVANDSLTMKKMVDLGVDLAYWEENDWLGYAMRLDFAKDVAPKVKFLVEKVGLNLADIGIMFSLSAELVCDQEVSDFEARVNYLESKDFSKKTISDIVSTEPFWLTYSVEEIDGRLGFLQNFFKLSGNEVRRMAGDLPGLVIWPGLPAQIRFNAFALKEQCGFSEAECKDIALKDPRIFMVDEEDKITERFRLLHLEAGFPHELLSKMPFAIGGALETPLPRLEARVKFLKAIGRDKFDPTQPNFVSPETLFLGSDEDFCLNVARASISVFNNFCKSL